MNGFLRIVLVALLLAPLGSCTASTTGGATDLGRATEAGRATETGRATDPTTIPGGGTDADGDGVPDEIEARVGSDPHSADTDGDGLTDRFEILKALVAHDPAKWDTDGDGMSDADEDFDADGLTALEEQARGTNPIQADSDGDTRSDPAELGTYGTDPNDPDTDHDKLNDGAEIRMGTNPLDPDTDDDGILDGDDINSAVVAGPAGVSVEVSGTGDIAGAVQIRERSDHPRAVLAGQKGSAYEFTLNPTIKVNLADAKINLPYDPADPTLGDPCDLHVFALSNEVPTWVPVNDTVAVDEVAHVVTLRVTLSVSQDPLYAVFNLVEWLEFVKGPPDPRPARAC